MGKYEAVKYWKVTKAKSEHECSLCARYIEVGEEYYRQTIAPVRPPPGLVLLIRCTRCQEESIPVIWKPVSGVSGSVPREAPAFEKEST